MEVFVYKSARRADTYVYFGAREDFARLPPELVERLGALTFVLELDLTPERKLARTDARVVLANIAARGFHLQAPALTEMPGDAAW
jgi:uncharacterized protein